MKILHVVYSCEPGHHKGGVSKAVHELAVAQQANGADVEVWSVSSHESCSYNHGYLHRRFTGGRFLGSIYSRCIIKSLGSVATPAIVHLHNTFHALNVQVGRRAHDLGMKVVCHPHGALDPVLMAGISPKSVKKRVYCALFEIPFLNNSNAVIALTEQERQGLLAQGVMSPIHVIPNGIHLPTQCVTKPAGHCRITKLLYVGRINPKKRIEDIISAMSQLVAQGNDVRLSIAGDECQFPDYSSSLRALIQRLNLTEYISWLGFQNEQQKAKLFSEADIFLHSSESEGMAMAILEAMSHAVPVIASRGCYMSNAAAAGALIEYDADPDQLARAVAKVVGMNIEDRAILGKAGYSYVAKHHSWTSIASSLAYIYETC